MLALKSARDLVLMAHGSTTAAASVNLLFAAANELLREMGQQLVAMKNSPDPEARRLVGKILAWIHDPKHDAAIASHGHVTVPPPDQENG